MTPQGVSVVSVSYSDDRRPMHLWLQVALGTMPIAAALAGVLLTKMGTGRYLDPESAWSLPSVIAFSAAGTVLLSVRRARPVAVVLLVAGMLGGGLEF